jgi:glycosyltransferase involved in cell wall biosynthesis
MPRFSVCIPNYNYAHYLGATLESVLAQDFGDLEVVVSDNASTDSSLEVVRGTGDERVHVQVNRCNVGFAPNVERAARAATGEIMLLLSSDDLMRPQALSRYDALFNAVGEEPVVISATCDLVDSDGERRGSVGPNDLVWRDAPRDDALSERIGQPVLSLRADELLRRCLRTMRNPFHFLATAYPAAAYQAVEGYGAGRLMNPDKWFHWRLLGVVDRALFVDEPLFGYRWHSGNQTATQAREGALKFLIDDYTSTFEMSEPLLAKAGLTRDEVTAAFIEYDIARHGLATLARGDRHQARRIAGFGRAVYPSAARRNPKVLGLDVLARLGPVGERVAAFAHRRAGERRPDLAEIARGRFTVAAES